MFLQHFLIHIIDKVKKRNLPALNLEVHSNSYLGLFISIFDKMKYLILISAIFVSNISFGQDAIIPKPTIEIKRLYAGVNVSPDYCYRTLYNRDVNYSIWLIDVRNDQEIPKIGYTAGLNFGYNVSQLLGIEIGIQYSNKGYSTKYFNLTFGDMTDPRFGFTYTTSNDPLPNKGKFVYNHYYLDIPLRAIFRFGKKRVQLVTSVGITTNIFLNATTTSVLKFENGEAEYKTQTQKYAYKSLNVSPTISIGAEYKINNKINLRAEPTFRYGLFNIIHAPIIAKLWSGGFNISCYYTFK